MVRKVFFSFHFKPDSWRASTVRQIGAIEGNQAVSDNAWESIANQGDAAIARWIGRQMRGRTCTVVLVGARTAKRKWIDYEIERSWKDGKGIVGIHVHQLKDAAGLTARKGANPFAHFRVGGLRLSSVVRCYDPPFKRSTNVYRYIADNIQGWIEEAIEIRQHY